MAVTIELGLTGTASIVVSPEATALAQGTGDVEVLSTHDLLKLMQQATMDAMRGHLPDKVITAGLRVNLDHLQGAPVGDELTATATLIRIEGRRLVFETEVVSEGGVVGRGRIIRVQVDRDHFLRRL